MNARRLASLAAIALGGLLFSGCATPALWEEGKFDRFHEPANPADLRIFCSTNRNDFLVQYTEVREGDGATTRRSYWLGRNIHHAKPHFASRNAANGLEVVPVYDTQEPALALPPQALYAIVSTNNGSFCLYQGQQLLGAFDLPDYADWTGIAKQVLLTPPAVVADATIVGGVLAVYAWASLGSYWVR